MCVCIYKVVCGAWPSVLNDLSYFPTSPQLQRTNSGRPKPSSRSYIHTYMHYIHCTHTYIHTWTMHTSLLTPGWQYVPHSTTLHMPHNITHTYAFHSVCSYIRTCSGHYSFKPLEVDGLHIIDTLGQTVCQLDFLMFLHNNSKKLSQNATHCTTHHTSTCATVLHSMTVWQVYYAMEDF